MPIWDLTLKDCIPLIGSGITVAGAGLIAYFATWSLNKSIKQTEFFLKFTERFHEVMKGKHELELSMEETDEDGNLKLSERAVRKKATELYRQLFSIMSDEFSAYRRGFLKREAFSDWMRWRALEYQKNQNGEADFVVGDIAYHDGWKLECRSSRVRSEFVDFLNQIHHIPPGAILDDAIRSTVLRFSSLRQRIGAGLCHLAECWILWWFIALVIIVPTMYRIFA